MKLVTFSKKDFAHFYQWLCLDEEGITWQGKYHHDFHDFWSIFFISDISLDQLTSRFSYVCRQVKIGPLNAWFKWLQQKFITYCFIHKGMSIEEISDQSKMPPSQVAFLLRDFYVSHFPLMLDQLNDCFELGNISDPCFSMNVDELNKKLEIEENIMGSDQNETMATLEITPLSGMAKNCFAR